MTNNTIINNETINNTNKKENKTMKKDYTLNGKLTATTWKEFREEMKKAGINPATKTYLQLVEEYNALTTNVVSVGDMSSDKYEISETKAENKPIEKSNKPDVINSLPDNIINKLLGNLHYYRRKFDARGLIEVSDAYKAVRRTFVGQLEASYIKGVINFMYKQGYLKFNKDRGLQLFLTFKDVVRDNSGNVIGVKSF